MDGDHGPFNVPDFWRRSTFSLPDEPGQTLFGDSQLGEYDTLSVTWTYHSDMTELPLIDDHFDTELRLPQIDDFQFGTLHDLRANQEPDLTPTVPDSPTPTSLSNHLDDLWKLDLTTPTKNVPLRTWEAFTHHDHTESPISYLSDAGPRAFDALQPDDTNIIQSAFALKCLALLGLGRSSTLFQWKKEANTFVPTLDNVRLSGLSSTAFDSIVHRLSAIGCTFVDARHFAMTTYANKHPLAARVALATTIHAVLEALDQNLSDRVMTAESALRLLACFDTPVILLAELKELITSTSRATTDTAFLSDCHDTIRRFTNACSPFHSLHAEILDHVSQPWFQAICQNTGLTHNQFDLPIQTDVLNGSAHVSGEDKALITEVTTAITMLRDCAPDHPLLHPAAWGVDSLSPELSSAATDIDRIIDKANKYQEDLLAAISKYNSGRPNSSDTNTRPQEHHLVSEQLPWSLDEAQQTYFEDVGTRFSEPPVNMDTSNIRTLTTSILEACTTPETSNLDLRHLAKASLNHLQPYLQVQSRLLNGILLRLFFRQFSLREHLTLNHSFHLLGNGLFVQHLTAALFTSDSNARGLRLDNHSKQWPPASSELRLGLMGVLSEAYGSNDIPGNLSFAIRELGDEEIEKCLDANSIHALDFLRLRYEAPTPLNVILDDTAMAKYDDCFRVLLGVLRVLHFVTLLRSTAQQKDSTPATQAFAHEAWSCVSSLASYFFDIAVAGPWKDLQRTLDTIEADLAIEDAEGVFGQRVSFGISHLRNKHADMLDTIRSRLFLRSRHDNVRGLVNDVFACILDVHVDAYDETKLWTQRDEVKVKVSGLVDALQELARKIGKKKALSLQDRDDVFAVEVLSFRLDG
ncbi:hypothetical protein E4T48_06184 [Aureobasidium sp. EXF-10727]|nr:hypothetical protein E4T48_06184 [Aureobasidium sp. EXF-10727]KAI4725730.1 hypothetical protein E4T49_06512 [Aureobasidium sp. EXF-10728]